MNIINYSILAVADYRTCRIHNTKDEDTTRLPPFVSTRNGTIINLLVCFERCGPCFLQGDQGRERNRELFFASPFRDADSGLDKLNADMHIVLVVSGSAYLIGNFIITFLSVRKRCA